MKKHHKWALVAYIAGAVTGGFVFSFVRGIFKAA